MERDVTDRAAERTSLIDLLRGVPLFAGVPDERLAWVADRGTEVRLEPGGRIATEGDPADGFYVLLEGETEWTKRVGQQESHVVTLGPGTVFAELILLLDAPYPTSGRALTAVRLLKLAPDAFWQLLSASPAVLRRIVAVAAERSQLHESVSQQGAKLASLGAIAAGLAHELNNPAAAVARSAAAAREVFAGRSARAFALADRGLTPAERNFIADLPGAVRERANSSRPAGAGLDPLARSDQEDEVAAWLDERGVTRGWEIAPTLVGAGLDTTWLAGVADGVPDSALGDVLEWLEAEVTGAGLLAEIEGGRHASRCWSGRSRTIPSWTGRPDRRWMCARGWRAPSPSSASGSTRG